ncbi:molybdopterin-dependent oxidoreductase [Sphingomonas sp. RHCKR47]|uniref:molybdopterin cofactor-binding domain-containing protein n=1 Tax=Sphingomonas citricola TaxID=2862498 RepID=UPI001CA589FE|nr:molybdopterin cofactor-binding domain-containing protein [Sphingomonas citricola]MBW6522931.1 molybdopterin-dependent oxidoreductase [Sphingomonas citricola]
MPTLSRRNLLVAGGAGVGLLVAWSAWPRRYAPNLPVATDETLFGGYLKIARDGRVIVAVPQVEHGQGVFTTLPQIVADELGADWRTVAVEPAPINPLYANPLAAEALFAGGFEHVPPGLRDEHWTRDAVMLTGGSTSLRRFEQVLREAGAAARVLLCKAAAARWDADWQACDTADGFVVLEGRKLRFGELAEAAATYSVPDELPLRFGDDGRLSGQSLPRLDAPAKVDGSANYAGDVRLPDMVFASLRQGPIGDTRLRSFNRAAAEAVQGVAGIVARDTWVAVAANNWWAANRALDALAPRFETRGPVIDDASIDRALDAALADDGHRVAAAGDISAVLSGAQLHTADYHAGLALHPALETPGATAHWRDGTLELWIATQAPTSARDAAAAALGIAAAKVTVHAMLVGGSFGQALETEVAQQAAILARELKRPVQLTWSRGESALRDRFRAPARARMSARIGAGGAILGWQAKIAAPATGAELAARLLPNDPLRRAAAVLRGGVDGYAMSGAVPPYAIPAIAIDHHPAAIGVPVGHLRGLADGYNAFFTECFIDELAQASGNEPMSYRIGMLGGNARLARCLTTASALGGWQGGVVGSGQGIACHAVAGSFIAVMAEARIDDAGRVRVERLVAAVDCGRTVNPDVVRQQIEGGLILGVALATGCSTGIGRNLADTRMFGDFGLPTLATAPEVTVELIQSTADPGGVSDLGIPAVAPAVANALRTASGSRYRSLPLQPRV